MELGPRQAMRVVKLVQQPSVQRPQVDMGRRQFVKQGVQSFASLALLSSLSSTPLRFLGKPQNIKTTNIDDIGIQKQAHQAILSGSVFQYLYTVATDNLYEDQKNIRKDLEIISYDDKNDTYVVGLNLPQENKLVDQKAISQGNLLFGSVSISENKMVTASQITYTEYKQNTEIHFISPDGHLHIRANKTEKEKPERISHIPLTIDDTLAQRIGYNYKADPFLYFYRSRLKNESSIEQIDKVIEQRQSSCSLTCGFIAVLICTAPSGGLAVIICGFIAVWTCSWICDPPCVGEQCG